MNTVKEIMYKSALTFMMLVMAISPFSSSRPQLSMSFQNILILFFMSWCIGLSFVIFKFKKIPQLVRRIIHICVCYGISLAFFLPFASAQSQTLIMFFVISAVFAVAYPLLMLITYLCAKLEKKTSFME